MDAILSRYGQRKILNVFYSTSTDGHDWASMIEAAKIKCNVGQEHVQVVFMQARAREVLNAGR